MPNISPIQAFSLGADAAYLAKRPLPVAPDGHYDWQTGADANLSPEGHSGITNLINRVFFKIPRPIFPPALTSITLGRECQGKRCPPSGSPCCRMYFSASFHVGRPQSQTLRVHSWTLSSIPILSMTVRAQ